MPNRSRKKRPRDINQLAAQIVQEATGQAERTPSPQEGKDPAAVTLGRKGGLKGGPARAKKLTKKERVASAKKAATARWLQKAQTAPDSKNQVGKATKSHSRKK